MEAIRVAGMSLNLSNTAPVFSTGCSGSQLVEVRVPDAVILTLSNPPLLQVVQDGTATVTVAVDGPAFVDMLTSQPYTCGGEFPAPTPAELAQVVTVN